MAQKTDKVEEHNSKRSSIPLLTHQPGDPGVNPSEFNPVDQKKADEAYMNSYEYILVDLENEELVASANVEENLLPHATDYLKENEQYITQLAIYQLKSVLS